MKPIKMIRKLFVPASAVIVVLFLILVYYLAMNPSKENNTIPVKGNNGSGHSNAVVPKDSAIEKQESKITTESNAHVESVPVSIEKDPIRLTGTVLQLTGLQNESTQKAINDAITMDTQKFMDELGAPKSQTRNASAISIRVDTPLHSLNGQLFSILLRYQVSDSQSGILPAMYQSYSFDLSSGKKMTLSDLFREDYDYRSILQSDINKQIAAAPKSYYSNYKELTVISDNHTFYIEDNTYLHVHFPPKMISNDGEKSDFRIPLQSIKPGLKPNLFPSLK